MASSTCSRPKPNAIVSRVEIAAPPWVVCAGVVGEVQLGLLLAQRLLQAGLERIPVSVRRRVTDFVRGVALPSRSCVGSLPAAVSTVNGATPAKIESAVGAIGAAL